ncbi:MAG: Flp pilus assembly protein CpaB [Vicinamibacterales bacterium]
MSRSTRTLVVFSLSLVVAAIFSGLVYKAGQQMPASPDVATYSVAVAARALPVGTRLTAADVKLVQWPSETPIAGAVTSVEAAVNRGLVASVVENEPLTGTKLASAEAGAGLPPMIAAGMRAISVKVDDVVGVAGFALPGAHVDVVVTIAEREQSLARVVVSNVEVLASGTRAEQQAQASNANARQSADSVVTLLVSPGDAERIALAASVGRITLTLRHPMDASTTDTTGTRVASLLGAPEPKPEPAPRPAPARVVRAAPAPVEPPPPPPAPYTVETIRAAKRTAEVVK